jgi:hypothetical protein
MLCQRADMRSRFAARAAPISGVREKSAIKFSSGLPILI